MKAFLNLSMLQKLAFPIVIALAVMIGLAWYAKSGFDELALETSNLIDRSALNRSLILEMSGELDAAIIVMQAKIGALVGAYAEELERGKQAASALAVHLFETLAAGATLGILVSLGLLVYIGLHLTARPMQRMTRDLARLAGGDYAVEVAD